MTKITMPEPVAFLIDWPDEPDLGHYFAEEQTPAGRSRPLITTTQAEAYADARVREVLEALEGLQRLADRAYSQYIEALRTDECLGWEHKVKTGKFGEGELKAHNRAAEFLGRHRALSEAAEAIRALVPPPPGPAIEPKERHGNQPAQTSQG